MSKHYCVALILRNGQQFWGKAREGPCRDPIPPELLEGTLMSCSIGPCVPNAESRSAASQRRLGYEAMPRKRPPGCALSIMTSP